MDTLILFLHFRPLTLNLHINMTEPPQGAAQLGEVEFCTLGMFILGNYAYLLPGAPRPTYLQCIFMQMKSISVVPDQVSKIFLEAQLRLLYWALAWSRDRRTHDLSVGLLMLGPTFHPRRWQRSSHGAPTVSSGRIVADLQQEHGMGIIPMRSEVS